MTHQVHVQVVLYKHLKKSNAACFYTLIVSKLLIIVQIRKQNEEEK